MMGKLQKRKNKKVLKKKRKRLEEGVGSKADVREVYGADAVAALRLRTDAATAPAIRTWDLHNLVLWVLAEAVSPAWVHVVRKPLVSNAVMVVVAGLTRAIFDRYGAEEMPFLSSTALRFDQTSDSSQVSRLSALTDLLNCSDRKKNLKAAFKVLAVAEGNNSNTNSSTNSNSNSNSNSNKKQKKQQQQQREKEEEKKKGGESRLSFLVDEETRRANRYPMAGEDNTAGFAVTVVHKDAPSRWATHPPLIAIDCEMVETKDGRELARVTLVDEAGAVLCDMLVVPPNPVLDYHTQYSGVTAALLATSPHRLADAQRAFCEHVSADHVLVGHGLENDLQAMRVCHARCLDTALAYPHIAGPPRKSKLSYLALKYLRREIQTGGAEGHCSEEDAVAALDLAKLKLARGLDFAVPRDAQLSLLGILAAHKRKVGLVASQQLASLQCHPAASAFPVPNKDDAAMAAVAAKQAAAYDFLFVHMEGPLWAREAAGGPRCAPEVGAAWAPADVTRWVTDHEAQWEAALRQSLRDTDAHLRRVFEALPDNGLFIATSGHGCFSLTQSLQKARISLQDAQTEMRAELERRVKEEQRAMSRAYSWLRVKTPAS